MRRPEFSVEAGRRNCVAELRGGTIALVHEEYVEAVLGLVERVPPGRVVTYGLVAESVRPAFGGPRQVGAVMALHGGGVPWWRVVRADGSLPPSHQREAAPHYTAEGTPRTASGRVDVRRAIWLPPDPLNPQPDDAAVDKAAIHVDGEDPAVEDTPRSANSPK